MAVNGAYIVEAQLFKNGSRNDHTFKVFLCSAGQLANGWQIAEQLFTALADGCI